jgi:hypothetical protein
MSNHDKSWWISYDFQIGKWVVSEIPFTVVRPGMEIIHLKEISREEIPEFPQDRNSPINFDRQ